MNPDESSTPWLEADEWEGDNGLLGNRRGLEILREAIDHALAHPGDATPIPVDCGSIRVVKVCDPPPPSGPTPVRDKILLGIFLAVLVTIPLLALFGLHQLIKLLSS